MGPGTGLGVTAGHRRVKDARSAPHSARSATQISSNCGNKWKVVAELRLLTFESGTERGAGSV